MRRVFIVMLIFAMLVTPVIGYGQSEAEEAKLNVVSTIFPGYDFVREIAGEHVNLTMLLPPGSESHSFEPTPQDIITIQSSDLFIYVGGESDAWVDRILDSMDTSKIKALSMMNMVEVVEEEIKEGMEDDHDHSEQIDPEDVHDRPLSDWQGSWTTVEEALESGVLDEYVGHQAEENGTDFDTQKAAYGERWATEHRTLLITDETVTFAGGETPYKYIGYRVVEEESGSAVWYGFEAENPANSDPTYIAFSDHGTGGEHEEEHGEDEEHGEEIPHFHMRYGNESFDALTTMKGWSPTYFAADASGEAIAETMGGHGHSEEAEYDEHVWTSPVNAKRIVFAISDALCALDEGNAEIYRKNCADYGDKLDQLDASFREVVSIAARDTLIFGDRFPFRYFVNEYGLDYYAAFPGCSTETEPSVKTVAFLIDKVNEEKIPVVFHIEFSNEKMADTICESTGAKKLLLHSCHNVTKTDFENGVSYLELMAQNVEQLKKALS